MNAVNGKADQMLLGEKKCFSHFGEDQILTFLFGETNNSGFFVDVGCYHPTLYSNTYAFYERGWRGVLVDANPSMIELCREQRPDDIAVNKAIGATCGRTTLYKFNDWGSSNTIDVAFRDAVSTSQNVQVTQEIDLEMISLSALFNTYCHDRPIDILNIDIENLDYSALTGNDWAVFRPKVIAVEDLALDLNDLSKSNTFTFLSKRSYRLESQAAYTSIYVADEARSTLNVRV